MKTLIQLDNNRRLRIEQDDIPESPREWDNLGTLACWHRRDNYGDVQPKQDREEWYTENVQKGDLCLQVRMYQHSDVRIYLAGSGNDCPWDSGWLGFYLVKQAQLDKEFPGLPREEQVKKARDIVEGELETYTQYLNGDVWWFCVEEAVLGGWDIVDSCGGFYGSDPAENGMCDCLSAEDAEVVRGERDPVNNRFSEGA